MARRTSNKIEPAAMTMTFVIPSVGSAAAVHHIDLSQCASLLNRRFYRQGLNWAVASMKAVTVTQQTGAQISVAKLPNTWTMSNSWEKSMRTWMRMNKEAMEETISVRPRFMDFKIYANADHHNAGFGANLLPISSATTSSPVQIAKLGEWEASKISIPLVTPAGVFTPGETVERELLAVGPSYPGAGASTLDAVSLIEGYASSRGLPNILDPNTPEDASDTGGGTPENWMSAIFNEGTQQTAEVLEELITENNQAPYPFENGTDLDPLLPGGLPNPNFGLPFADTQYPGGANNLGSLELHDFEVVTASTIGGTTRLKGGNFPCGLIELQTFGYTEGSSVTVQVNLVPGNHRGYLCEPMTEM